MAPISVVHMTVSSLLQHGIEKYDSISKQSINLGGAQIYQLRGWKQPDTSPIVFNHEKFGSVLRGLAATLYSFNRVRLNPDGTPVKTNKGQNQRINSGLMLYMQYGEDGVTARQAKDLLIQELPEFRSNLAAVADLIQDIPELSKLSEVQVPTTGDGTLQPMNPLKCVILAVASGSLTSAQYWSFKSKSATSGRAGLDSVTKVDTGLEGL